MRRPLAQTLASALALLALSTLSLSASAHTDATTHSHVGFVAGLVHPFTGLDHLAAMLAVGVWSALTANSSNHWRSSLWSPAWFAAFLLGGAVLGWQGGQVGGVEPMIAVSLLVMGLLLAARQALPRSTAALMVSGFALFHGLAHGYELPASGAATTLLGLLLATAALHALGLAAGWRLRQQVWATRLAGATVALMGGAALMPFVA